MVLQAQELAPSGIMLVILSQKCNVYKAKQRFEKNLAPKKGLAKTLKSNLKIKIPTCNLPLFLILQTYVYWYCLKSMQMTSSP